MKKRNVEKFVVKKAITEKFRKSAIPSMQRLLNKEDKEKRNVFKIYASGSSAIVQTNRSELAL